MKETVGIIIAILLSMAWGYGLSSIINEKECTKPEKTLSIEELKKACPNIGEKLEEFMGGDITFTEEGQAWIDSICEVSK